MNICGLLVHVESNRLDAVRGELTAMPGLIVHLATPDNRLVITVEDQPEISAADTALAVHRVKGVLSAALVYHHDEPDEALEQSEGEEA